jgi:hypothetical protein
MTTRQGEPDCSIGLGSSFYLYKGFCEGAKDVLRGGIGVKKTKKPVSVMHHFLSLDMIPPRWTSLIFSQHRALLVQMW